MPAGYRIGLTVRGKDYEYGGGERRQASNFKNELNGCGPFLHDDPRDRPPPFSTAPPACILDAAKRLI